MAHVHRHGFMMHRHPIVERLCHLFKAINCLFWAKNFGFPLNYY